MSEQAFKKRYEKATGGKYGDIYDTNWVKAGNDPDRVKRAKKLSAEARKEWADNGYKGGSWNRAVEKKLKPILEECDDVLLSDMKIENVKAGRKMLKKYNLNTKWNDFDFLNDV